MPTFTKTFEGAMDRVRDRNFNINEALKFLLAKQRRPSSSDKIGKVVLTCLNGPVLELDETCSVKSTSPKLGTPISNTLDIMKMTFRKLGMNRGDNVVADTGTILNASTEVWPSLKFINERLNASQREAVEFSIDRSKFTIVFGAPGTGKTMAQVELVQLLTGPSEKVLVLTSQLS